MDASIKRSLAEEVRRQTTKYLHTLDFARTKSGFWTRPSELFVDFVHLHLYSFAPEFRVHIGSQVLNDPFEAIALDGPATRPVFERYNIVGEGELLDAASRLDWVTGTTLSVNAPKAVSPPVQD